ncbi:MAG: hypothetical protein Q8O11_11325, partial [Syntrophales bacterium]|nr:hypothetical protein [Syntrophales bacterium]
SCTRITGEESEHPPLTSCSQNRSLLKNRKSGQLICYKTGQFYLLLTGEFIGQKEFFSTDSGKGRRLGSGLPIPAKPPHFSKKKV